MENSLNNPVQGEKESQEKQFNIHNHEQSVTRSVKVMIEFPLKKESNRPDEKDEWPPPPGNAEITGDKNLDLADKTAGMQENRLLFNGVVKGDHNEGLEGVAVMAFACYKGEIEKPLGYTFTGNDGTYIISIPEFFDYKNLEGFKVRAGKGIPPSEGTGRRVNYSESPRTASSNNDFYSFLKLVSTNPNKTIFDLLRRI